MNIFLIFRTLSIDYGKVITTYLHYNLTEDKKLIKFKLPWLRKKKCYNVTNYDIAYILLIHKNENLNTCKYKNDLDFKFNWVYLPYLKLGNLSKFHTARGNHNERGDKSD